MVAGRARARGIYPPLRPTRRAPPMLASVVAGGSSVPSRSEQPSLHRGGPQESARAVAATADGVVAKRGDRSLPPPSTEPWQARFLAEYLGKWKRVEADGGPTIELKTAVSAVRFHSLHHGF